MVYASLVSLSCMEASAPRSGFKPYVGEGFISPYRQLVTDLVKDLVTDHPSFARAIQKRCLGPAGRLALPVTFMSKYLVGSQGQVMLEDQDGVCWKIDWIAYMQSGRRLAFTHGWHAFVSHHKIEDGDIFIAEIVTPEHWKAHILSAESGYSRRTSLQLDHDAEELVDVNKKGSCTEDAEDGKHSNEVNNKMCHIQTSPLSFLKAENRITRRKRSGQRKSREGSHPFADSPLQASLQKCNSLHKEELLGSDSDEGSMPSLNDSVQQVSTLLKRDEIYEHVVEKKYEDENFVFGSKESLRQSCFPHREDAIFLSSDIGKSFNKNKAYEARYCQFTKEPCHQYALHGFQHCILHILEDASAPYKQCDFMDKQTYARCGFPVCLNIADTRFCQIHSRHDVAAPDTRNPGNALWNILPKLGDLSLMMMAAMVAHQSHNEADFWVLKNFQASRISCETNGNFNSDSLIEGRKFCRDKFKSPKQNLSMMNMQLLPAKVNEENIVQYLGWKFHAASKGNSEMTRQVDRTENDLSYVDEVEERTEGFSVGQNPIPSPSFGNTNDDGLDMCKETVMLGIEKGSILEASSDCNVDRTSSFTGQERTLCAMHVQGKHISFSRFVGIRKRPWDVSDCGVHDGEHQPNGHYIKQEGKQLNDTAAVASTVAICGEMEHRPVRNKVMNVGIVKQEADEMISDAPKNSATSFGQQISSDKRGVDGFMCVNLSLSAKDGKMPSRHGTPSLCVADGKVGMDNVFLDPGSNDSSQCSYKVREEINSTSTMTTDLTLASTCCKEEQNISSRENRIRYGPLQFETVFKNSKMEHIVKRADSISLVPEGTNIQYATKAGFFKELSLTLPGVQNYEVQSDDSIDSLPEEPRVTTQLYKRFLDLNDSEHERNKIL